MNSPAAVVQIDVITEAMIILVRGAGVDLNCDIDTAEDRVFRVLWGSNGSGFPWPVIKPRLATVIARARELGPTTLAAA